MQDSLARLCISPTASIEQVIELIERTGKGIALVVGLDRLLLSVVTDGDIRRAILADLDLTSPVQTLIEHKADTSRSNPITAPIGTSETELLRIMNQHVLRHIPLVDNAGKVQNLALMSDLVHVNDLPMSAVIMAGGQGKRLRPLTEDTPKPMLSIGDKPLMERVVEQLRGAGIRRVNVTTHYQPGVITDYFGDGERFGVEIQYVEEEHPLGTAGAISLLNVTAEPLLVINGDVLTQVDFRALLDFHIEQNADMTVAVRQHDFQFPYGVVETVGANISGIVEKPTVKQLIIAGIYMLSPDTCRSVPAESPLDMPELITKLIADNRRVVCFPIHEYWLDIGQHSDYQKAQADFARGKTM
jgi:dTDP-glucose pyrophosphorylase